MRCIEYLYPHSLRHATIPCVVQQASHGLHGMLRPRNHAPSYKGASSSVTSRAGCLYLSLLFLHVYFFDPFLVVFCVSLSFVHLRRGSRVYYGSKPFPHHDDSFQHRLATNRFLELNMDDLNYYKIINFIMYNLILEGLFVVSSGILMASRPPIFFSLRLCAKIGATCCMSTGGEASNQKYMKQFSLSFNFIYCDIIILWQSFNQYCYCFIVVLS